MRPGADDADGASVWPAAPLATQRVENLVEWDENRPTRLTLNLSGKIASRLPLPSCAAQCMVPQLRFMNALPYGIFVCAKYEIDGFANMGLTHLLSLEDPQVPKATPVWFAGHHIQLHFHDVESLREANSVRAQIPTREHVAEILKMGERCLAHEGPSPARLLVHCYAGASRSPAAAYALICQALKDTKASEALEFVLRLRPEAFPNALVVRLADELLGRNREMLRALAPLRATFNQLVDEWIASRNVDGRP